MSVQTVPSVWLDSPAFFREAAPDTVEIVLTGRVSNEAGDAIDAVLEVRSVHVHTEDAGVFELLLGVALTDSEPLMITVTADDYLSSSFSVGLSGSGRQSDGTLVALRDVTLQAAAA